MDKVIEALQSLINKYKFNIDVLSRLTGIKSKNLLNRDYEAIFKDTKNVSKICDLILMLDTIGDESADLKIGAFLEVLIDYHKITPETIALMSDVEERDVNNLMKNYFLVSMENKYKICKTVMSLRFLLKELEGFEIY